MVGRDTPARVATSDNDNLRAPVVSMSRRAASSIRSARSPRAEPAPCGSAIDTTATPAFSPNSGRYRIEPAESTQPRDQQPQPVVEGDGLITETPGGQVVVASQLALAFGSRLRNGHQGGPEFGGQRLGVRAVIEILDTMVDSGDLAGSIDSAGGAEAFLRSAHQQIALAGHAAIQRRDRAHRDVLARHPRHWKSQVA